MADPDGRYRLVNQAVLSPGVDIITKSSTGPLVDTGVDIDLDPFISYDLKDPRGRDQVHRFSRLYLHPTTIRELAQVAGVLQFQPEGAIIRESQAYSMGYADAIKERVGDQLLELASRLGDLLPVLANAPAGELAAAEKPAADADDSGDDGAGEREPSGSARSSV